MSLGTPSGLLAAELESEVLLNRAVAFCAARLHVDVEQAVTALCNGEALAHSTLRYRIAKGIAGYLGRLECGVCGVYLYGSAMTGDAHIASDIDLIVVVHRKLDQAYTLLQRLDLALVTSYQGLLGPIRGPARLLDVQFVDVEEQRKRSGCGAILRSEEASPICLWC